MLEVEGIQVYYGELRALKGVSLSVAKGEIVALLGNNGAGKTTTLKAISGLLQPRQGSIRFEEQRLDGLPPHKIAQMGVAHVPEGRKVFHRLTVLENLEIGAYARRDKAVTEDLAQVFVLFPRLKERRRQIAGTLSGGEQQMLAIARALMAHPRLLLLDEPSMGLAPTLVEQIFETIQAINRRGTTILLVEQNATLALSIAHRGYVMETGRVVMHAEASVLLADENVRKAYLGE